MSKNQNVAPRLVPSVPPNVAERSGSTLRYTPTSEGGEGAADLLRQAQVPLTRKLIALALNGDRVALRCCMEQIASLTADRPIQLDLPPIHSVADLPVATRAILEAVSSGRITPSAAAALSKCIATHMDALTNVDLLQTLERLEQVER